MHWYNYIFCVASYFLNNSKCWFIIFSPATELMFSRSIFQRPHEGVILFENGCFCGFEWFLMQLQEYVRRNSTASIQLSLLPLPFWAWPKCFVARFLSTPSQTRVLYSWAFFFQWCITLTATWYWFLQISSFQQSPIKLLTAETSCCKLLFRHLDAHLVISKGCVSLLKKLVAIMESKN